MKLISLGLSPPERPAVSEKRNNPLENPSVSLNEVANWGWLLDGDQTDAGELINPETALKISTVFTCCKVLSESVASLPLRLLKVTPQGKVQELEDPLAFLLGVQPNPEMTSFVFFETLTFHLMLTGNCYAQIQRSEDGSPIALWPLNPRVTRALRLPNGDLAYETSDGEAGTGKRIIASEDCIHVPLMSHDGIVGLSPIMQARRSLGLAAAAAKFGSRLFANNATPQIALMSKKKVRPEDIPKMRADWESMHSGTNQHRVAILDQDLDLKVLSITPESMNGLRLLQSTACRCTLQVLNRSSATATLNN
jgi:HK97 family phage portal protein